MLEQPLFRVAYQTSSRQVQSKAGFVSRLRNSWLCIHKKISEENKSKTLIWNLIRAGKQSYLFTKRLKDKKCSQCTLLHCTMPFWSAVRYHQAFKTFRDFRRKLSYFRDYNPPSFLSKFQSWTPRKLFFSHDIRSF